MGSNVASGRRSHRHMGVDEDGDHERDREARPRRGADPSGTADGSRPPSPPRGRLGRGDRCSFGASPGRCGAGAAPAPRRRCRSAWRRPAGERAAFRPADVPLPRPASCRRRRAGRPPRGRHRRLTLNGGGGIRTHESSRTPVFKTGALSRSATPPVPLRSPRSPMAFKTGEALREPSACPPRVHSRPSRPKLANFLANSPAANAETASAP